MELLSNSKDFKYSIPRILLDKDSILFISSLIILLSLFSSTKAKFLALAKDTPLSK